MHHGDAAVNTVVEDLRWPGPQFGGALGSRHRCDGVQVRMPLRAVAPPTTAMGRSFGFLVSTRAVPAPSRVHAEPPPKGLTPDPMVCSDAKTLEKERIGPAGGRTRFWWTVRLAEYGGLSFVTHESSIGVEQP